MNTREIATAQEDILEMSGRFCSQNPHQQQLMRYVGLEGLSHFIEGDLNSCSLLL